MSICLNNYGITNSKSEKLLGIKIDHKLNFNTHINEICKKVGQKLNALSWVTPYKDLSKRQMLVNVFFLSQFSYPPLVWIGHINSKNNEINCLHKKCLPLICNENLHIMNYWKQIIACLNT